MNERPILFSGEMVRALLDGRKTQTRRVVKPQPANGWSFETADGDPMRLGRITSPHPKKGRFGVFVRREIHPRSGKYEHDIICGPYGQPGGRLWVRETWAEEHPLAIQEGRYSQPGRAGIPGPPPVNYRTIYRADGEPRQIWRNRGGHPYYTLDGPVDERDAQYPTVRSNYTRGGGKGIHWAPSIHMPRWACRITLEIVSVRVERLQDISEDDAQAEGVGPAFSYPGWDGIAGQPQYRWGFHKLWESINGPDSWAANPWVWVVEFKRLDDGNSTRTVTGENHD